MEFKILNEEQFREFSKNHKYESFMQTVELGNLKNELGNTIHYVGVFKNKKLIAATLLLEEKSIMGRKTFYAPRGFLIDYDDKDTLKFFTDELKKYIKCHKGFMLTIDPNVIYRVRSSEGEIINDDKEKNDVLVNNLKELGYKHFGFNKYLESLQVRWEYRLKLDRPYEEISKNFSKSTRKNIESCYKKGLLVRKGAIEDLPSMEKIFESTSKRKDFFYRSLDYYQKMYKHMHELMTIYIAYLNPDIYYNHTKDLLNDEKKNNDEILKKMETSCVGNKLLHQKEVSDNLIEKYKEELEKAKQFKKEYPNGKDVGVLLSMKSGDEYLTLSSGLLEEYKNFTPKYALYDSHIKDAYEMGYKYVDFYGITGDFEKTNPYYGIYEFKKGFNGNVVELVGQFSLKVTSFYNFYNLLRKIKHKIKK
ncbi:MAG: peptidoglycan bridge formation glycyltransferase FemA/FemB family protein [Bacilli bacterium]|nr:peptidoglycan bridge formation glycyltransferase FemA/FemB family protein [Bacilli bacterium]